MKPSDEQLRRIGRGLGWAEAYELEQGKKAIELCGPIVLAAPTSDEWGKAAYEDTSESRIDRDGKAFLSAYAVAQILANRLRSLTEPEKDEAVEAVREIIRTRVGITEDSIAEIVAAVRKADSK